jgi:hypothetical protein
MKIASAELPKYKQTQLWARARDSWFGEWVRASRRCRHELWSCATYRQPATHTVDQLAKAIAALQSISAEIANENSDETDTEAPIFLLSTGWRAGSTLLQRILITDPHLLMWGEPLGEMTLASRFSEIISDFISPRNQLLWRRQENPNSPTLATSWVANLYPSPDDFRSALRGLFDQWLAEPARRRGFTRWGFKEVRFGATEASFLHWLYPNAKFVLISRHPYDCYRSLVDSLWKEVYYRYPDVCIDSAASFAMCWNQIAVSWNQLPSEFPCFHIRYDDLIAGKIDFRKIESWLDLKIQEDVALKASVSSTAKRSGLNWYERPIIAQKAQSGMRDLGYSP